MTSPVRELRRVLEPYHLAYLAPEGKDLYEEAGLRGGWMRYFAARSSPLGAASADLVVATFYGFHRRLVERAVPEAWQRCEPSDVIDVRLAAADASIHATYPHVLTAPDLPRIATRLRRTAENCDPAARPLFAAHASLAWPDDQHLVLWWAATLLREHRGDGHIALLLAEGIGPCESLVWHAATGEIPGDYLRSIRGWNEDEWTAATDTLMHRGWLDGEGTLTEAGRTARESLETATDDLALQPWRALGDRDLTDVVRLVHEVVAAA